MNEPKRGEYRHAGRDELTARQLEVLRYVAAGYGDRAIGDALCITTHAAKRHVRDILSKLDAVNRAHAVHTAHQKGILR